MEPPDKRQLDLRQAEGMDRSKSPARTSGEPTVMVPTAASLGVDLDKAPTVFDRRVYRCLSTP